MENDEIAMDRFEGVRSEWNGRSWGNEEKKGETKGRSGERRG